MRNPEFLGTLAEGLLASGETAQALAPVEEALTISRQGWQLWCLADLLRIKAEILLANAPSDLSRAEVLFAEGLSIARDQQCRFYELKVAAAWAGIMARSNRQQTALDLVGPVSALFDQGDRPSRPRLVPATSIPAAGSATRPASAPRLWRSPATPLQAMQDSSRRPPCKPSCSGSARLRRSDRCLCRRHRRRPPESLRAQGLRPLAGSTTAETTHS